MLDRLKEREIVNDIRQNRIEAWLELYDAYFMVLWKRVRLFFGNEQSANEVTREIFSIAAARSRYIDLSRETIWQWLWNIANEQIRKEYERKFRQERVGFAVTNIFCVDEKVRAKPFDAEAHPVVVETKDMAEIARNALAKLDPVHQCVLAGKAIDGYTLRQITKEVNYNGDDARSLIEESYKSFRESFKEVATVAIKDKADDQTSDTQVETLLKQLHKHQMPADEMFMDMVRSKSLEDFIAGPPKESIISAEDMKRIRIVALATLALILIATIAYVTKKQHTRKAKLMEKFNTADSKMQDEKATIDENAEIKIPEALEKKVTPAEQEIERITENARKFAEAGDIDSLMQMLKRSDMLGKMVAARYLAIVGDENAIEALEAESKNWFGGEESDIFAAAIHKIEQRLGTKTDAKDKTSKAKNRDVSNISVSGSIVGDYDEPVQNVNISGYILQYESWDTLNGPKQISKIPGKTTKTNNEGSFLLQDMKFAPNKKERLAVVFEHPDYGLFWYWADQTPAQDFVVAMPDKTVISGVVVNEDGDPITNAAVSAQVTADEETNTFWFNQANGFGAVTDDQGKFIFENIPAQSSVIFSINHNNYLAYESQEAVDSSAVSQSEEPIQIFLEEGQKKQLTITDETEESVQANLFIERMGEFKTDKDGRIELSLPNTGLISGFAYDVSGKMAASFSFDAQQAQDENLVLQLENGIEIAGQITDPEDNPITNADIRILFVKPDGSFMPAKWNLWLKEYNPEGVFNLSQIPAGLDFEVYIQTPQSSRSIPVLNAQSGDILNFDQIILEPQD